jgi:hypothetical protein
VRGAGGKRRGLTLHGKGLASAPYRQRALEGTGRLGRKSRQAVFRPGAGDGTTRTRGRSNRRRQPWHGRTRTTRRGAGSVSESSRGRHHTPRKSRGPILGVARRTRHPKPRGRGSAGSRAGPAYAPDGDAEWSSPHGRFCNREPPVPGDAEWSCPHGHFCNRETPDSIRRRTHRVVAGRAGWPGEASLGGRNGERH